MITGPSHVGKKIGRIEPAMAPAESCPSAPMFQTLERYESARPTAIRISGVILTIRSWIDHHAVSFSMK